MQTSLRLPVIGPFSTGMYGSTAGTIVTFSGLAGRYDSWGADRLSLYLLLTDPLEYIFIAALWVGVAFLGGVIIRKRVERAQLALQLLHGD